MTMAKRTSLVDCPVCGPASAAPWMRQDGWSVVRCSNCDLAMTWPRPATEVLAEIYSARDYYISRGMDDGVFEESTLRAREILEQSKQPVRKILDFGAGEGHLVAAFRTLGVEAEGVETSPAGRSEARRRYGIELWATLPERRPADCDVI